MGDSPEVKTYFNTIYYVPGDGEGLEFIAKTYSLSTFRDEDFFVSAKVVAFGSDEFLAERITHIAFYMDDNDFTPILKTRVLVDKKSMSAAASRILVKGTMIGCATKKGESAPSDDGDKKPLNKPQSVRTFRVETVKAPSEWKKLDLDTRLESLLMVKAPRPARSRSVGPEHKKRSNSKPAVSKSKEAAANIVPPATGTNFPSLPINDDLLKRLNALLNLAKDEAKRVEVRIVKDHVMLIP